MNKDRRKAYDFNVTNGEAASRHTLDILIFYLNHANLYRPHFWNLRGAIERPYRIIACGIKFSEFDEQDQGVVVRDLLAETCAARLNVKKRKCICVAHSLCGTFLQQLLLSASELQPPDLIHSIHGIIYFSTPQRDGIGLTLQDSLNSICEVLGKRRLGNYRDANFVRRKRQDYVKCFPQILILECVEDNKTIVDKQSSRVGILKADTEYYTYLGGDHWSVFSSENLTVALKQFIGLLNTKRLWIPILLKSSKPARKPITPMIMGARLPTRDQYPAMGDRPIYLPSFSTIIFVVLPINFVSIAVVNFRRKYSQIDFPLATDVAILLGLTLFYTACLAILLRAMLKGVRLPAICLPVLIVFASTIIFVSHNMLTVLFVGLPISLTAAVNFICLAPYSSLPRKRWARNLIWRRSPQDRLLGHNRNETQFSTTVNGLPEVLPRPTDNENDQSSSGPYDDLEKAPSSALRRLRSLPRMRP